jgi:hypothetical protein
MLAAGLVLPTCVFAENSPPAAPEPVFESLAMLPCGVFEKDDANVPGQPAGWRSDAPAEAWRLDRKTFLQGAGSLRLAGGAPVVVVSDPIPLDAEFTGLSAVAMGRGTGGTAKVRWLAGDGTTLREDALHAMKSPEASGWTRHTLSETERPEKAQRIVCVLEANAPAGESFWWDAVEITGSHERVPTAVVLINQAGYESFAPKHFVVASNMPVSDATFTVDSNSGRPALKGTLENSSRITGAGGADWGRYYYRGDFTALDEDGEYTIHARLDNLEAASPEFALRFDQLWNTAFDRAVRALAVCRNEGSGPLWNDPGKPAVSDADAFWTLVSGWSALRWKIDLLGGASPLTDELRWAAPRAVKRVEGAAADTLPQWAAALARYALQEKSDTAAAEAAKNAVNALKAAGGKGPLAFSAAWDLFAATNDAVWKEQATAWFPGVNIEAIETLLAYENEDGGMLSMDVARAMEQLADTLLKRSGNPFGVYATEDKGTPCYFLPSPTEPAGTPEGMGDTHRVLMAAELMAKAYRFAPKPEYLGFIYDQFNWVLGCNPQGVCLMEGVGSAHVAKIAGPAADRRDTLAGVILNGIGPVGPGDDRPWIAVHDTDTATEATNGFALRNNVRFIGAMAHLKRIRTVQPQDKQAK